MVKVQGSYRGGRRGESGQAVPVFAAVLVFAGLVGFGLVRVASVAAERAAAEAAADAAALAGADAGRQAAAQVAAANGAGLVAYRRERLDVVVTVERRGHRATARARWVPVTAGGPRPGAEPP